MRDLIVVGGGPAGLVTALHARRAGLAVAVLEPRPAPVDKACGEGLMPGAVRALAELGIDPGGVPFRGIRYCTGGHAAVADFRRGPGRAVRRTALHAALRRAAERAGVEFAPGRVTGLEHRADGVRAGGMSGRYLVGADGLHSAVRRLAGIPASTGPHRRWGQRAHFACVPWSERVEVHWAAHAEAYVTPVAADCVGVALLTDRPGRYPDLLRGFPELAGRLPPSPVAPVRAAGPLHQRVAAPVAGRVLLVGDAAGYVDALTGEGLALAFTAARALVAAVVAGEPSRYAAEHRRITRRYRLLTSALLAAGRRPLGRRAIVPLAERAPGLFAAIVNELAG